MSVVLIYGVGRSGTTTIYSTIQGLMSKFHNESIDFSYEPFLWNPLVFNKMYKEVSTEFSKASSLSITGMYLNKRIPLLINEDVESILAGLDQYSVDYLRRICLESEKKKAVLAKMIRANGRYKIFNYLNKNVKNIFVIRNPIDVINSSIVKFSFYGDDFYSTDYDRFRLEARNIYGSEIDDYPIGSEVEKEAFYWYISNKYFLENTAADLNVLCVNYDAYVNHKKTYLENIAAYIKVPFVDSAKKLSEEKVGPTTPQINISRSEYNSLQFYYDLYVGLVQKFMPEQYIDDKKIHKKYSQTKSAVERDNKYKGNTSLYIRNSIVKEEMESKKNRKLYNLFKCFKCSTY